MIRLTHIFIASLGLLLACVEAHAATHATGIRILVYGIHYGGNLVYNYKVINNGDTAFNNFTIGSVFDSVEDEDYPQLTRLPLGWSWGERGEVGTEILLELEDERLALLELGCEMDRDGCSGNRRR